MKTRFEKYKNYREIIATVILILVLGLGLLFTYRKMMNSVRSDCYSNLAEADEKYVNELNSSIQIIEKRLEPMASILSLYSESSDIEQTAAFLKSLNEDYPDLKMGILYPDNKILLNDGSLVDAKGSLSFEEESKKETHISEVSDLIGSYNKMGLRIFVPIVKDKKTISLLYAVMDLDKLADLFKVDAYNGSSQLFIADGNRGKFIMDSRHMRTNANISEFIGEKFLPGFSAEKVLSDIASGRSGNAAYYSDYDGQVLYMYYCPAGIDKWTVFLAVPESVAFQESSKTANNLTFLAFYYFIAFLIYLLILSCFNRNALAEKEQRLDLIQFMHQIEETLFDFHIETSRMTQALDQVARNLKAEHAFLLVLQNGKINVVFQNEPENSTFASLCGDALENIMPCWLEIWKHHNELNVSIDAASGVELDLMKRARIRNVFAVPLYDASKSLWAILGVADTEITPEVREKLQKSSITFAMALGNREAYYKIEKMGIMDLTTNLLSHNSYLKYVGSYTPDPDKRLACIYVDANGLHEYNNLYGHEAGDRFLQAIANELRSEFPDGKSYRMGGDEFMTIVFKMNEAEIREKTLNIKQRLTEKDYPVSIGIACDSEGSDLEKVASAADIKMLEEKRIYYHNFGNRRSRE